jgi:bifunctional DNA primase/polymerase-like protein
MTGIFAAWQPRYAEKHVATFPVEGKRPRVRAWDKVGLRGSAQLAMKFADADAFGFRCGHRSRITLLDIDSPDEKIVSEAITAFGESPVIWRTGSGNYAMPFRYNDEARRIRPVPGLPIDILGDGYAVAPPSMGAKGRYEFVQGSLADLDHLPRLRVDKIARPEAPRPEVTRQGQRHDALKRALTSEIWHCGTWEDFLDRAITIGTMHCTPPLDDAEITDLAAWFWRHKDMGLLIRPGHRHWTDDVFDLLPTDRLAALLLFALRKEHPFDDQQFVIANAWAKALGMNRHTLVAARSKLQALGHVVLVKRASSIKPALYRWPRREGQGERASTIIGGLNWPPTTGLMDFVPNYRRHTCD